MSSRIEIAPAALRNSSLADKPGPMDIPGDLGRLERDNAEGHSRIVHAGATFAVTCPTSKPR